MEVKDNKVGVPLEHYRERYRALNPLEASERSGVPYDEAGERFVLRFLGRDIYLTYPELTGSYADTGETLSPAALILLCRLILEGKLEKTAGRFLAYNEMPWGELYHGNFKGRCISRLAYGFGYNLDGFKRAAYALGGVPAEFGDLAFDFEFLPNLRLRLIFWEADDEFPPAAQILFSDNFQFAFSAEDMAVVGDVTIDALKKNK